MIYVKRNDQTSNWLLVDDLGRFVNSGYSSRAEAQAAANRVNDVPDFKHLDRSRFVVWGDQIEDHQQTTQAGWYPIIGRTIKPITSGGDSRKVQGTIYGLPFRGITDEASGCLVEVEILGIYLTYGELNLGDFYQEVANSYGQWEVMGIEPSGSIIIDARYAGKVSGTPRDHGSSRASITHKQETPVILLNAEAAQ